MVDLHRRLFLASHEKASEMTIWLHIEMPGRRGYSLSFSDVRRAAQAYSAELRTGGAQVSVEVLFD